MMIFYTLGKIVIIVFAVVVHECAHGFVAYRLGDNTAKSLGRLTLNPLKHVDPVGTIIVPGTIFLLRFFAAVVDVDFRVSSAVSTLRPMGNMYLSPPSTGPFLTWYRTTVFPPITMFMGETASW